MASITIRNLDNDMKARLRLRAAQHDQALPARIHHRFAAVYQQHGEQDDLPIPPRQATRVPPQFD